MSKGVVSSSETNVLKLQQENMLLQAKLIDRQQQCEYWQARCYRYKESYEQLSHKYSVLKQKDRLLLASYRQLRVLQLQHDLNPQLLLAQNLSEDHII